MKRLRAAERLYKEFNPDQPRVPAGNPDGGQWTDAGGDNGAAADDNSASAGDEPGSGQSEPAATTIDGRVWERFPNAEFRDRLATAEQTADKPNFGYGDVNPRSDALGRYQMTSSALRAAGMMDTAGSWTGKYGIDSAAQFLGSPQAQESALTDYLSDTERQLRTNGSFNYIGANIDGRVARFTVTAAGLVAAGHREGAAETRRYLHALQDAGFSSGRAKLAAEGLHVETRLRTFADVPYR